MNISELTDFSEASLDAAFAEVRQEAQRDISSLTMDKEALKLKWLGRKQGQLKLLSDAWIKTAPREAIPSIGKRFNAI